MKAHRAELAKERADVAALRVGDIQSLLVRRKREPVGLLEIIHEQYQLARRFDGKHALEGQFLFAPATQAIISAFGWMAAIALHIAVTAPSLRKPPLGFAP